MPFTYRYFSPFGWTDFTSNSSSSTQFIDGIGASWEWSLSDAQNQTQPDQSVGLATSNGPSGRATYYAKPSVESSVYVISNPKYIKKIDVLSAADIEITYTDNSTELLNTFSQAIPNTFTAPANQCIVQFDLDERGFFGVTYGDIPVNIAEIVDPASISGYLTLNSNNALIGFCSGHSTNAVNYFFTPSTAPPAGNTFTKTLFGANRFLCGIDMINGSSSIILYSRDASGMKQNVTTVNVGTVRNYPYESMFNSNQCITGIGFAYTKNCFVMSQTATSTYNIVSVYASDGTPTIPPAPTNFQGVSNSTGRLDLTWFQPTATPAVTGYTIELKDGNNTTIRNSGNITAPATSFTFNNLPLSINVTAYITACSDWGCASTKPSVTTNISNNPAIPPVPNIYINRRTNIAGTVWATISFADPNYVANPPISSFTVLATDLKTNETTLFPGITSTTGAVLSGLIGNYYNFQVKATNDLGTSAYSNGMIGNSENTVGGVYILNKPITPVLSSIVVTKITGQVILNMNVSLPSLPTTMSVYYYPIGNASSTQTITNIPVASTYTVKGLTNFTNYAFYVMTSNTYGVSSNSNTLMATPLPPMAIPASPVLVSCNAIDGTRVLVNFTHNTYTDPPVSNFLVHYVIPGNGESKATMFVTQSPVIITGLIPFTTYDVWLQAENSLGISNNSNTISVLTENNNTVTPPITPVLTGVVMTTIDSVEKVQISFTTVFNASFYKVIFTALNANNSWSRSFTEFTSPVTVDQTSLGSGVNYQVHVLAINSAGSSQPSNILTILMPGEIVEPPAETTNNKTTIMILAAAILLACSAAIGGYYYYYKQHRLSTTDSSKKL